MFLLPTPIWHVSQHKKEPHKAQVCLCAKDCSLMVHSGVGIVTKISLAAWLANQNHMFTVASLASLYHSPWVMTTRRSVMRSRMKCPRAGQPCLARPAAAHTPPSRPYLGSVYLWPQRRWLAWPRCAAGTRSTTPWFIGWKIYNERWSPASWGSERLLDGRKLVRCGRSWPRTLCVARFSVSSFFSLVSNTSTNQRAFHPTTALLDHCWMSMVGQTIELWVMTRWAGVMSNES